MVPLADGDGTLGDLAASGLASFELFDDDTQAREWPVPTSRSLGSMLPITACGGLVLIAVALLASGQTAGGDAEERGEPLQPGAQLQAARATAVVTSTSSAAARATAAVASTSSTAAPCSITTPTRAELGERPRHGAARQAVQAPATSTTSATGTSSAGAAATTRPTAPVGGSAPPAPAAVAVAPGRGATAGAPEVPRPAAGAPASGGGVASSAPPASSTMSPTTATATTSTAASCVDSLWDHYPQCRTDSAQMRALRCRSWPLQHKAPAPRISRALYINLDRDARRRRWMEGQLQQVRRNLTKGTARNFPVERVSAVDMQRAAKDTRFEGIRQQGFNPTQYPDVQGKWSVAGCTFSHLTILWRLRDHAEELLARREVWLVLEDDAAVGPDLEAAWEGLWPWLPEEWDLVRLGWFGGSTCAGRVNRRVDLALWSDPPPAGPCSYCGSHAYIVNPASVGKVIHRLEGSRLMHVDCLLGAPTPPMEDPHTLPPLLAFAPRPSLIMPNEDFPSDRTD